MDGTRDRVHDPTTSILLFILQFTTMERWIEFSWATSPATKSDVLLVDKAFYHSET